MKNWKQALLAGLAFLAALALLLGFGQLLAARAIEAGRYTLWLVSSTLRSIDQDTLWTILIAAGGLVFFAAALRRLLTTLLSAGEEWAPETGSSGRLGYWLKQTRLASGHFIQESYALVEFRRLVLAVLAFRLQLDPEVVEARLRTGELEAPPAAAALFNRARRGREQPGAPAWLARLRRFVGGRDPDREVSDRTGSRLGDIVQYIEDELEINPHDTGL